MQQSDSKVEPILVGDTVSVKNRTDKHKANEMYLTVAKEGEKVKVQKILHPLERTPIKIMTKIYETDEKRLRMIHRTELIDEENNQLEDDPTIEKVERKIWNPIDQKFFSQEDSDEEDEITPGKPEVFPQVSLTQEQAAGENDEDFTGTDVGDNSELEWDETPEQLQLQIENTDEELTMILTPRKLFQDDVNTDSITSEPSDDEVFTVTEKESEQKSNKLQRRNAFRRKKQKINSKGSESLPRLPISVRRRERDVERRVTRASLSLPTTPSQVILHEPQLLGQVLPQLAPIVPEAVQMGPQVQQLGRALEGIGRPRRSTRRNIDYAKFNDIGDIS